MKNLLSHKVYIVFSIFSCYLSVGQIYFPTANSKWEKRNPQEYDISLRNYQKLFRLLNQMNILEKKI